MRIEQVATILVSAQRQERPIPQRSTDPDTSPPDVPPPPAGGPRPAGLGHRFLARLLDALTVGLLLSVLFAVLGLPAPTIGLGGTETMLWSVVTSGLWFAYYVLCEGTIGRTLGKRLAGVSVVRDAGGRPGIGAAAIRNAWLLFGIVPWIGGLALLAAVIAIVVTISRNPERRGVHDRLAATSVWL